MRGNKLRLLVLPVFACLALTVAACGSDDSSSDSSSDGGSTPSGPVASASANEAFKAVTGLDALDGPATTDELASRVEDYTAVPEELLIKEPLSKKAEPGKKLVYILTNVPVLEEFYSALTEAAGEVGYEVERIEQGATPEEFAQAYQQASDMNPDMVIGSGLPREFFNKQLNELASKGIPVIEWSSGIKPVKDELWTAVDDPIYEASGIQMAEYIAHDADMAANVVSYNVPQYPMPEIWLNTMEQYMNGICDDCSFDRQEAALDDIGSLGEKVTAYLQQNPDTKYVLCGFGDLCQGVGQALKTAGNDEVQVITRDQATTNLQNIANGTESAATGLAIGQTGWQIVDLAQRIFNGDSTDGTRLAPQQIITEVEDPSSDLIGAVPDYKEQYRELWQLGQ